MKVLIGTTNPAKIEGAKQAFAEFFENVEVEGIKSPSNVPDQPVNNDIYLGALNRVNNLIAKANEENLEADYFVAIESGITNSLGKWEIVNVAVIKDKTGYESFGTSAGFPVPTKYVEEIINTDLGQVMDKIFNASDLRSKKGGINSLTHGTITRGDLTKHAFIMALTQFINDNIWHD